MGHAPDLCGGMPAMAFPTAISRLASPPSTTGSTMFCVKVVENGPKRRNKLARHGRPLKSQAKRPGKQPPKKQYGKTATHKRMI